MLTSAIPGRLLENKRLELKLLVRPFASLLQLACEWPKATLWGTLGAPALGERGVLICEVGLPHLP